MQRDECDLLIKIQNTTKTTVQTPTTPFQSLPRFVLSSSGVFFFFRFRFILLNFFDQEETHAVNVWNPIKIDE